IELDLDGHGNLALHFLGRPARVLGDDLDGGGGRIGVGLNIEVLKGIEATQEQRHRPGHDQQPLVEKTINQRADHTSSGAAAGGSGRGWGEEQATTPGRPRATGLPRQDRYTTIVTPRVGRQRSAHGEGRAGGSPAKSVRLRALHAHSLRPAVRTYFMLLTSML